MARSIFYYPLFFTGIIGFIYAAYYLYLEDNGGGTINTSKLMKVQHLDRRTFFPTVPYPDQDAPAEEHEVVWAVFYYKPYCGSCRRIKPAFEALARTTNSTSNLRFADVDCVKEKNLCNHQNVMKQPTIVLYKSVYDTTQDPVYVHREPVATWRGMLIAYELFGWFQRQQYNGHISQEVEWPEYDDIAQAMLNYKLRARDQIESMITDANNLEQRAGYLPAVHAAVKMSLTDAVFTAKHTELKGTRKRAMVDYLDTLAYAYPKNTTRQDSQALSQLIQSHPKATPLTEDVFNSYLEQFPTLTGGTQVEDETWTDSWCVIKGPGVGGYPCGLWLLFHSLLANSDRATGAASLQAIQSWVVNFFGCTECAAHFKAMWNTYDGASQTGHIDTSLWLWEAHNRVRARLTDDDTVLEGSKNQFPFAGECVKCYSELVQDTIGFDLETEARAWVDYSTYDEELWSRSFVFDYLQELMCFESDTFTCAQFYDPSTGTVSQGPHLRTILIGCIVVLLLAMYGISKCFDALPNNEEDNEDDDESDEVLPILPPPSDSDEEAEDDKKTQSNKASSTGLRNRKQQTQGTDKKETQNQSSSQTSKSKKKKKRKN